MTDLKLGCQTSEAAAMRIALLLVTFTAVLACSTALPPGLLGRWRSDAARTLADIDERGLHTREQRAAMHGVFGELTFEFRADGTFDSTIEGHKESAEYRIVEVGADYVDFEAYDTLMEEMTVKRVWLEGEDSFWIWAGGENRRFKEYFRREP